MLNFIKKYKLILIFLLLILFSNINNVQAAIVDEDRGNLLKNNMYYLLQQLISEGKIASTDSSSYKYLINSGGSMIITRPSATCEVHSNGSGAFTYGGCYNINNGGKLADENTTFKCNWDKWNDPSYSWNAYSTSFGSGIVYSNVGYKDSTNPIFEPYVEKVEESPFHLEYNENTKSYFVYTDYMDFQTFSGGVSAYFNINGFQTNFYWDTYENYGWKLMDYENSTYENENGTNDWRFYQEIFEYGEYYFCLRNHLTNSHKIYCIKITADSSIISMYNENYIDSSDMFVDIEKNTYENKDYLSNNNQNFYINYVDNIAVVYSNYFKEDDAYYYDCLFSKDYLNYSNDIITEYYDGVNTNYSKYYRFCKEIDENGTYYFRLRKIDKATGNVINSNIYTINIDGIIINNIGENNSVEFYKNTNTMEYFRKTLGIIFFPIDMMFDFFERLENIQYEEPIIEVPDIKEPFTRTSFY